MVAERMLLSAENDFRKDFLTMRRFQKTSNFASKYSFSILVKLGKALKVPGKGKVLIPSGTANTLHCWANLYLRKNNKF